MATRGRDRSLSGLGGGGCARRHRGRTQRVSSVGRASRGTARFLLHEGSRSDRGTRGAGRAGHDRRDGKAAARGSPRDVARGDDPPLCRGRGVPADRRDVRAVRRRPATLHLAPPAGRRGAHHAVELPDRDPGLEARAGPHLRQYARPQARLRGAADGAPRRGVLRGGRPAAWCPERPHGGRLQGRRGDRLEPRCARHLVHGLGACGSLRPR